MRPALYFMLIAATILITGCAHCFIVVNAGVANKSASALAAQLSPESYCLALTAPNVMYKSKPAPHMTTEQIDFCNQVLKETMKETQP